MDDGNTFILNLSPDELRLGDDGLTIGCTVRNNLGVTSCENVTLEVGEVTDQVYLPAMNRP